MVDKKEDKRKGEALRVRLKAPEVAWVRRAADEDGRTINGFLRKLVLDAMPKA